MALRRRRGYIKQPPWPWRGAHAKGIEDLWDDVLLQITVFSCLDCVVGPIGRTMASVKH